MRPRLNHQGKRAALERDKAEWNAKMQNVSRASVGGAVKETLGAAGDAAAVRELSDGA